MHSDSNLNSSTPEPTRFLERLQSNKPLIGVELRPPRSDLTRSGAIDSWIDLSHSVRRVVSRDAFLMLTDNTVGQEEEENLQHLTINLTSEVEPWRLVPFLTTKHSLEYCLHYGDRAQLGGLDALTVVGGDVIGAARCVPHSYELRQQLRERAPGMALGGWVNPHHPTDEQIQFVMDPNFEADYYLTQVVSQHELPMVERWLRATDDAGLNIPGAFGVFFYRNGRRDSLKRLSSFLPVPVDEIAAEFESGISPVKHCANAIIALRKLGIKHIYLCNLGAHRAGALFEQILAEIQIQSTGPS